SGAVTSRPRRRPSRSEEATQTITQIRHELLPTPIGRPLPNSSRVIEAGPRECGERMFQAFPTRFQPPRMPSSPCVHCRVGARRGDLMLPAGVDPAVVWVHHSCREAWWLARRAQAAAALASVGIGP